MRAICKSNRGEAIPSSKRYLGELDQTDYAPLKIGESYLVYALLFIFDRVDFLVGAPDQPPFWAPGCLFDLIDAKIPLGREFCITRSRTEYALLLEVFGINYIAGYSLLVNDYKHYVGIAERDPIEFQRFKDSVSGKYGWLSLFGRKVGGFIFPVSEGKSGQEKGTDLFFSEKGTDLFFSAIRMASSRK